jgi:hypothetical protein
MNGIPKEINVMGLSAFASNETVVVSHPRIGDLALHDSFLSLFTCRHPFSYNQYIK